MGRLFGQRQPPSPIEEPQWATPEGTRIYAIGDIHGSIVPLRLLLDAIREHAEAHPIKRKCLIFLGDYIDRGMDSRAVLELLQQPLPGFETTYLKGNHEEGLLRFLAGSSSAISWIAYGGIATMFSYGAKPPDPVTDLEELLRARKDLAKKLPSQHLDFLAGLKRYHVEGDYLFVHAGLKPGVAIEDQRDDDILWIREEFLSSKVNFGKLIVHGHSISAEADVHPNRIGIDTGAFASGKLTCLVLEGTSQGLITT